MLFPTSVANSLIAVGTDGLQERDRMVRAAIAIICELGEYLAETDVREHSPDKDAPFNVAVYNT